MKKSIIAFTLMATLVSCGSTPIESKDQEVIVDPMLAELEEEYDVHKWQYDEFEDEMTSEKAFVAKIQSSDIAHFEFPYQGGSTLTLNIRKNGKELDAYIQISKGQINTDYQNPTVTFRFDEEPPVEFEVVETTDNDNTMRFIVKAPKLIEKLSKCTTFKIKCEFYTEGSHVFNFKNDNFLALK